MLNLLEDYIRNSLPENEGLQAFVTNPNLCKKVKGERFLPFYGNTVVFTLDADTRAQLDRLRQRLYQAAGWMLAEPLHPDTFHMTLHDLVNSPVRTGKLEKKMAEAEQQAKAILAQWQDPAPIRMCATWLFNMMNTSIVLGLAPADADSGRKLEEMYMELEAVVPLAYPLTPHITMAYYRPGTYTRYDLQHLKQALCPVALEIELQPRNLVFQNFSDMNTYSEEDIF